MLGIAALLVASVTAQTPTGPADTSSNGLGLARLTFVPDQPGFNPLPIRFERFSSPAPDPEPDAQPVPFAPPFDRWARPWAAAWELQDTTRRRRRAVRVSPGYATRLKIHQIGSYVMLPLFATQFILGQSLYHSEDRPQGLRTAHSIGAIAIGTVFTANTITGALNWWETRKAAEGRTRRTVHALLMLAADTGFLLTPQTAGDAKEELEGARRHRAMAEISISVSAASAIMMWLWKD
jgi:hypothetical protein